MSWGASAAAAAWDGPWAHWFPYPLPVPSRDVPPFGPGLTPAAGPLGACVTGRCDRSMLSSMEKVFLPSVNAARDSVAQPPFASITEMFTAAPLLLYMTAEPFEYPRSDWPASVRMVGPCCWDPPADPPSWLAGIDEPIVLVSTSIGVPRRRPARDHRARGTRARGRARRRNHPGRGDPTHRRAPPTRTSSSSCPTRRSRQSGVRGHARRRRARPRRHSPPDCQCASCRSAATSSRSPAASRSPTPARPPGTTPEPRPAASQDREAMTKRQGANRVADGFAATGGPTAGADATEKLLAGTDSNSREHIPGPDRARLLLTRAVANDPAQGG